MSDRFSMNGDGKNPQRPDPFSRNRGDKKSPRLGDERENQIIRQITGRYGELEELWEEAEKDLKRFRVYHPVRHSYNGRNLDPLDHHSPYVCENLGWVRYGRGWRICHCVFCDEANPDDNYDWKPVVDSPVDVRVEAIAHFEGLRKKVIEAAEKCVPKLDEAIATFRKVLKG